jgi:HlyD family secretion protein
LGAGGYFLYQRYQNNRAAQANNFETMPAARGDLTATVGGTGTVRANQTATLSFQTTGTVLSVNVTVGSVVKAGDKLAVLDKTSLPQNIILAEADLVTAQRNLNDLQNSSLAQAQAQVALANAQKALSDAKKKRANLGYSATDDQIQTARNDLVIAEDKVTKAQDAYDKVSDRAADDPLRAQLYNNLIAARQQRDQVQWNLDYLLGTANPDDIAQADSQIALAEAQLKDAQREWDRLKDGPDPADISAAQARIAAIQATLDMQTIQAPFGGTITAVDIKPGDQASPGLVAFRLDDLTRLLVDVQISEVDINRISAGQTVAMSFDAISNKDYQGQVSQVAQVGTIVQGSVNFDVTIELTNADADVLPAMTAAVNIVVDQLHDTLLVPNRAVRLQNNQRVVYVLRSGHSTPVNIVLGASSDTDSQVVSGDLHEGDLIILNPPLDLTSGGSSTFGGQ